MGATVNPTQPKDKWYPLLGGYSKISVWDIKLSGRSVMGGFGKAEVEHSAGALIMFLQWRNKEWKPFGLAELYKFYVQQKWDANEMLFGLLGPWLDDGHWGTHESGFLVHCLDSIAVTYEFIHRCYYHDRSE